MGLCWLQSGEPFVGKILEDFGGTSELTVQLGVQSTAVSGARLLPECGPDDLKISRLEDLFTRNAGRCFFLVQVGQGCTNQRLVDCNPVNGLHWAIDSLFKSLL